MKFSDMMGKDRRTASDEEAPTAATPPPPPPEAAPIRLGSERDELTDAAAALDPETPAEPAPPSISDVVAELAPRVPATDAGPRDPGSWLDGLTGVDDDLLPS